MKSLRHCFILLCVALLAAPAWAHKMAPSLLDIRELAGGEYAALFRTPADARKPPTPRFPSSCEPGSPVVNSQGTALEWRWKMTCSAGLAGLTFAVDGLLDSQTTALLRIEGGDGRLHEQLLRPESASYTVPESGVGASLWPQYLSLGFKHILIGLDHLLFVTGLLLLAGSWRQLLKTVTAFTVGHSVTLLLVSLQWIPHWAALVELAIAATILLLAVELSRPRADRAGWLGRQQWPMAAVFGLIHGLGFAGVLAELGLPSGRLVEAVLAFNIGIELGQLAFVAVLALLLFAAARRASAAQGLRWAAVYSMGSVSVFWCLDRGATLLSEMVL